MVKFVIVEDEEKDIQHIKELIDEVYKKNKLIVEYDGINNELRDEINDLDFHKIYILDIELANNISGLEIAKLIRDIDLQSEIIITTNHGSMFENAHRNIYSIFEFIEKYNDFDNRFKKAIEKIISKNFDNEMFVYKAANNIDLNIYYKSILYIYRDTLDRKLVIVTDHNKFIVNLNMKDILGKLDHRFKQCHRSCIVNKDRVQEFNYKEKYFILDNGQKEYMLSKLYQQKINS